MGGGRGTRDRTAPTRVVVVDDHRAFSESLCMAIDFQEDLACAGLATTVGEAVDLVLELAPDVVLMDVHLPDADGIEGTGRLKSLRPETRVLVLTADDNPDVMARAALAGASGFLLKEAPVEEILRAVRAAGEGGIMVDRVTFSAVLDRLRDGAEARRPGIERRPAMTRREREVLALMGEGLDPRMIAKRLGISLNTCRGYVKNILAKLGVHSQLEAVVKAIRGGLLPGPSA